MAQRQTLGFDESFAARSPRNQALERQWYHVRWAHMPVRASQCYRLLGRATWRLQVRGAWRMEGKRREASEIRTVLAGAMLGGYVPKEVRTVPEGLLRGRLTVSPPHHPKLRPQTNLPTGAVTFIRKYFVDWKSPHPYKPHLISRFSMTHTINLPCASANRCIVAIFPQPPFDGSCCPAC